MREDLPVGKAYVERMMREDADIEALKKRVGQDVFKKMIVMDVGHPLELGVIVRVLDDIFPDKRHKHGINMFNEVAHESPEVPEWFFTFGANGKVHIYWPRKNAREYDRAVTHAARIVVMSRSDAQQSYL